MLLLQVASVGQKDECDRKFWIKEMNVLDHRGVPEPLLGSPSTSKKSKANRGHS